MKLAMIMGLLSNLNLTKCDYMDINKCISNVADEEVQQKKAA
ncbi:MULTISPECIES: hypothetical protein [Clostridium]|nr:MULTISPECIES: hypothetical protein [Clostridium]